MLKELSSVSECWSERERERVSALLVLNCNLLDIANGMVTDWWEDEG